MIDRNPGAWLDQAVTLVGTAYDAHAGAIVVLADGIPVYVSGLPEWEARWLRTRVQVSGTLRRRKLAPDPEVGPGGEVSHGMQGEDLVLEGATWSAAQ